MPTDAFLHRRAESSQPMAIRTWSGIGDRRPRPR